MNDGFADRFAAWVKQHEAIAACLLALLCFAAMLLVFYFVVFSDFGGSADFIYNQF